MDLESRVIIGLGGAVGEESWKTDQPCSLSLYGTILYGVVLRGDVISSSTPSPRTRKILGFSFITTSVDRIDDVPTLPGRSSYHGHHGDYSEMPHSLRACRLAPERGVVS